MCVKDAIIFTCNFIISLNDVCEVAIDFFFFFHKIRKKKRLIDYSHMNINLQKLKIKD